MFCYKSIEGSRLAVLAAAVALATTVVFLFYKVHPAEAAANTFVGAGDIASCGASGDEATADLLDDIPGTVFTLGDNAYLDGTYADFKNCYEPSWGRHKARTRPTPGNHEYHTPGASGYFKYFGVNANPRKGYYSYNLGDWHIIALNSACDNVGGCGSTSPMVRWLKKDLAANRSKKCTLAYFHHPLFSSGEYGDQKMKSSWQALYAENADVVLSGHDHLYERFAPQRPSGKLDRSRGIRQFVVGTGGRALHSVVKIKPNSEVQDASTYGVLKLTLGSSGYGWEFVPAAGGTFTDTGSDDCH